MSELNRKRLAVWPVVIVAAALFSTAANAHVVNNYTPPDPVTITEDMPEWNCNTMGNRICGKGH